MDLHCMLFEYHADGWNPFYGNKNKIRNMILNKPYYLFGFFLSEVKIWLLLPIWSSTVKCPDNGKCTFECNSWIDQYIY